MAKVAKQIPDATAPKIRGEFFRLYRDKLHENPSCTIEEALTPFDSPMAVLKSEYGIDILDDPWFTGQDSAPETEVVIAALKECYKERRGHSKGQRPAIHDAVLLRWLLNQKHQGMSKIWVVTLDRSLPDYNAGSSSTPQPLAITLDALMQWISPIISTGDSSDDFAAIFAEAVNDQLVPQDRFFDLRDFLIFAEMDYSCKELPAPDVEECIRYYKTHAPNLDPTIPKDREVMAHHVAKFFVDPGRRYKDNLQALEARLEFIEAESKEIIEQKNESIRGKEKKIEELEAEVKQIKIDHENKILQRSAVRRALLCIALFIAIETTVGYLSSKYGDGDNLFRRLLAAWPIMGAGAIAGIILSWFIIGNDRFRVLGWAFRKAFKSDV